MESKEDFQIFPWSSYQEFKSVTNIVLNLEFDSNLLHNFDFLKDLQVVERQLVIWRTKTTSAQHLYEIDATHSIVNCLLHEYLPKLGKLDSSRKTGQPKDHPDDLMNDQTDLNQKSLTDSQSASLAAIDASILHGSSFNLINEETIACLYSNAILKFFKMLSYYDIIDGKIERLLSRSEANLVRICEKLDFPQYIIEYRHRIAHNKVPSFEQLRAACQIALGWMKRNYWSRYVYLLDSQEKSKQQIYEQTTMMLSSLFEQEETNLDRLNSRLNAQLDDRPAKRQKVVELKKFNVLDRKQIGLLNDTLYDMLNDDFYTTLHAVTLYIVNSTKEHLDRISADQIKKWIEDDAVATSLALGDPPSPGQTNDGQSSNEPTTNQAASATEKRKREQLIPSHILNSFRPIFEIINRQLSSINQLLFYLHEIIEDQKIQLKTSAQAWFVQIICSLLNNLNYSSWNQRNPGKPDKSRPTLSEFERCFRLSDVQLNDLKWLHLFIRLVEEPTMDQINLSLVKRIYPLVSFRYPRSKFNQICELLTIYLDGGELGTAGRKRLQPASSEEPDEPEEMLDCQLTDTIDWSRVRLGFI